MALDLQAPADLYPGRTRLNEEQHQIPAGMGREEFRAMGTTVTLLLPEAQLYRGAQITRQLFVHWEQTLSRFLLDSELSQLNQRAGDPVHVGDLLFHVLRAALAAAEESDGLFDPTLLTQMQHLGYDRSFDHLPAVLPANGQPAQPGGAWREIQLSYLRKTVRLPAGIGIDLGGIAKGMAVDAVLRQLCLSGIKTALINAGGDLVVMGMPEGYESWPLSIEGRESSWVIPFTHGALATSGISRRQWRQGTQTRHHLIDPRSGESAQSGLWSVTVATGTCEQAEVAAKIAFLLGAERGRAFLHRRELAGLLVGLDGEWTSAGPWPDELMQPIKSNTNNTNNTTIKTIQIMEEEKHE
jgi:thiamine biosynthesis lipoprotein